MALEARVLRTLDDPELRRILAELPPAYANLTLWEDRIARLMEERVFPQLWLHVPQMNMEIAAAYGGTGPLWEEFVESVPSQSRFNPDGAALLGDMVFENAVVERTTLLQGGRTLSEGVYQMIEAALERLADEQP